MVGKFGVAIDIRSALCLVAACVLLLQLCLLAEAAVHEERAQTARAAAAAVASLVLCIKDAAGGAALRAVQLAAQVDGLAHPERVDGAARPDPVAEELRVVFKVAAQGPELCQTLGCEDDT